ncbi:AcrB/AcrD/AcrF family protein [Microbulbifer flavimaris]|uniref:AcrB/AcrD/AcrF family protein n=1 Tax=Microbulbifer flavimaris TaxID=1781068 RepID=A0ABX4I2T7_9GAMM|nr:MULTISPECIES: efflux RND transporter permease subunit [Microbulbifer]KUJ84639.1 cobalt-zinc-cadmium resistance protein [Microbulbifer sp. ZGT114]PCO06727.1 AcrB/AcrD/AcrF family protein [Microbulbifer flavimaris]
MSGLDTGKKLPREPVNLHGGPIAWMAHNHVTANLLMLVLILGGLVFATLVKKEVFPDFSLDMVTVQISYPGASPEEVERGVLVAAEQAVQGIPGIREMRGTANEGSATLSLELDEDAEGNKVYQDIQQAIDRVTTFPDDIERPQVSLADHQRDVLDLVVHGDIDIHALRGITMLLYEQLEAHPEITALETYGVRDFEVAVEVKGESLRRYGLSLPQVAQLVRDAAVDVPAGAVKTEAGEILVRVTERRDWAREFGEVVVVQAAGGGIVRLKDIATVRDALVEEPRNMNFNGQPAMGIDVFRVGDQTPMSVSLATREVLAEVVPTLPDGVEVSIRDDDSEIFRERLSLLLKNGFIGLMLVFIVLGAFLELRLAFWVTLGIPTSFLGALLFLPALDISINMVSMFAFIIALGIVVDDAIIAGENIYEWRRLGYSNLEAAIAGARQVAVPLTFAILTNIVAFVPLMHLPGFMGKIFGIIPLVVGSVFVISWVEALFILPAHLAYSRRGYRNARARRFAARQKMIARSLDRFVEKRFKPFLDLCIRHRYTTIALAVAILMVVTGYAASGRMGFTLLPRVERDSGRVQVTFPAGTAERQLERARSQITGAADRALEKMGREGVFLGMRGLVRDNTVQVDVYLVPADQRPFTTGEFVRTWRQEVGEVPGALSSSFAADRGGPGAGPALTVELRHTDTRTLEEVALRLASALAEFPNVSDIDPGISLGKQQLDLTLTDTAKSLGLTAEEIGRQLRASIYGAEAMRQQRGRDQVKVMVRLPEAQRGSLEDVSSIMVQAPGNIWLPLPDLVVIDQGRAYSGINRREGRRVMTVTANVEPADQATLVINELDRSMVPQLKAEYAGLGISYEGRQAEEREGLTSLGLTFTLTMAALYLLLAIPLKSYIQPLTVMVAIPFGVIGALLGHLIMGYGLSMISLLGMVALAGVVINDTLVMIEYGNRLREQGVEVTDAIKQAAARRFRPIILTTVTTFCGLTPMIFETSVQARFLIPMAISLGYGILAATTISLLLVPCLYLMFARDIPLLFGLRNRSGLANS